MTTWEDVGQSARRFRGPLVLGGTVLVVVLLAAPLGAHRLPVVPGMASAWLAIVVAGDALTAAFLVARFRAGLSARQLMLACAYLWATVMLLGAWVTEPWVLRPAAPIGDPDARWWLWVSGHVVPLVFVAAALSRRSGSWRRQDTAPDRARAALAFLWPPAACAVAIALACCLAARSLPTIARSAAPDAALGLLPALVVALAGAALLGVGALGAYRRRSYDVLELWSLAAATALLGQLVLATAGRPEASVAADASRLLGLVAALAVLVHLLRTVAVVNRGTAEFATRLQEQNGALLEAQRLRDHLVAVVSHEMRTPLAGLQGYLELLASDETRDSDAADRMLERSWLLTRRLTLLAVDLLAVAAVEHGDFVVIPETVNLAHQLDECAATFPDLDLRVSCPSGLVVHADTLRLQQVLNNLVRNAQKHGAEPITITCSDDIDHVTIRVADSGTGVPADFVHRLFDRYSQGASRAAGGSGLGLSVVRDLVRAHGGSVRYDLTDPAFVIELPQHAQARRRGAGLAPVVPKRVAVLEPISEEPAAQERSLVLEQQA